MGKWSKTPPPVDRQFHFTEGDATEEAVRFELASRELSRRRLDHFVLRFNERYMMGWVHADMCHRLNRFSRMVEEALSPRQMYLIPPRHGKSTLVSKNLPAWHLGRCPWHEFIAASYAQSLPLSFSREVRGMFRDPTYQVLFPGAQLDPDNQAAEDWKTTQKGGYIAAGVGGGITGRGAHILSIDDPVKNAEEADSRIIQDTNWDWYGSTAYTRLAPGGGVLVTMTCWNMNDLAGRLEDEMNMDDNADQFEIVRYPAIAMEDEWLDLPEYDHLLPWAKVVEGGKMLIRRKNEGLHPERYDEKQLARIKATLTERHWSALYQGRPIPEEGLLFTQSMFIQGDQPDREYSVPMCAWDFAISEKQVADYTVGSVGWLGPSGMLHVPAVVRMKTSDTYMMVEAIINTVAQLRHPGVIVGFEDGHIFKTLRPVLERRMQERRVFFVIEVLPPLTDKLIRARPLQARMQQRMLSFAHGAPWYDTVRSELLRFPAGGKDDIVDSLSWLAQLALRVRPRAMPRLESKLPKSWRDKVAEAHKRAGSFMGA
jgi:predicted phage terminase large subunit-like protein